MKPQNSRVSQKQMADAVNEEAKLFGDAISCMIREGKELVEHQTEANKEETDMQHLLEEMQLDSSLLGEGQEHLKSSRCTHQCWLAAWPTPPPKSEWGEQVEEMAEGRTTTSRSRMLHRPH